MLCCVALQPAAVTDKRSRKRSRLLSKDFCSGLNPRFRCICHSVAQQTPTLQYAFKAHCKGGDAPRHLRAGDELNLDCPLTLPKTRPIGARADSWGRTIKEASSTTITYDLASDGAAATAQQQRPPGPMSAIDKAAVVTAAAAESADCSTPAWIQGARLAALTSISFCS